MEILQKLKKTGDELYSARKYLEAIKEYTKAIELDNSEYSLYSNRAACYIAIKEFKNALSDSEKVISLKPDFAKGYSRKAHSLSELGKINEALEVYELGLERTKGDKSLVKKYKQIVQNKDHGIISKKILSQALMNPQILEWYTNDREFKKEVDSLVGKVLTQVELENISKDLKMMKFFHSVGIFGEKKAFVQKNIDKELDDQTEKTSLKNMKQKLEEKKNEAEMIKKEGTKFYKNKEYRRALECYQKASKLFPQEPSYILNQAAVLLMENELDDCEKTCLEVINISRANQADYKWPAKAYTRLASIEEKRGNLKKAIQYLVESLTEFKDDKVKEKLRQLKKKLKFQEQEKQLNPEEALKLKIKADEAFRLMKWKDAINLYIESIKRNPNDPKVYNNCSTAYCKLMAWGPALDDASKAIVLNPKWIKPYLRKAKIEQACKTYHKALITLKLAGSNVENPKDPLLQKAIYELNVAISIANQKDDPERQQRALEDPQIQVIMQDPIISALLKAAQSDPTRIQKAMTNETVREKIELLAAAGIIR